MERCRKKIKSRIIVFLAAILFCVALSAVMQHAQDAAVQDDNSAIQMLADNSYAAKEFSQSLFDEYMIAQGITDYRIEQVAYGFDTSEVAGSVYMVGYLYEANGKLVKYGYKIAVDERGNCSLIEEGVDIGAFVLED